MKVTVTPLSKKDHYHVRLDNGVEVCEATVQYHVESSGIQALNCPSGMLWNFLLDSIHTAKESQAILSQIFNQIHEHCTE